MSDAASKPFGIAHIAAGILFVLLATMNAAGYRYAASDQAFYIPAVVRHLQPKAFPHDAALIDSQAHLTLIDEVVAAGVRLTGVSLPHTFVTLYVLSLLLLAGGAARIGGRLYRTGWAVAALVAALTLRHAIARTGANTLESYFHPRQLAFAIGVWAIAAFLERRDRTWMALLLAAAVVHPTTAAWFGAWLVAAAFVGRPQWRPALAAAGMAVLVMIALLVWRGAFSDRLVRMDGDWLAAVGEKDLFPLAWPLDVWLTNVVAIPVILLCWRARHRAGLTIAGETPLVAGSMALVLLFVCWLPFNAARVAIAVQMQTARVFWILDVFATMYLIWWFAEGIGGRRRAALVAAIAVALSAARGAYVCFVQFPERHLFEVDIPKGDWRDAMAFASGTDPGSGWLADPIHAAKYGSSVRAAAYRDVLFEEMKDRAIAMYDRGVAMRVLDRDHALGALPWNTADGARALARRFGLDYLVIDRELDLPLVHRSGTLYIYGLR